MDYSSVVESLYERHRSVRDAGFSGDAYKPGLDAMLSYCDFLGHPERKFRSIHVAGTNGKGSVCSMLAAALAASGLRVGLYTSPHLVDFRERIKIIGPLATASLSDARQAVGHEIPWPPAASEREGPAPFGVGGKERAARAEGFLSNLPASGAWLAEMVPEEAVCEFMQRYDREGLTFFEVTTGMAFWWFAQQGVDVAVIETGLGGRLDSTNVITPDISIITSIGLDHCDLLGSTRAEIAAEKAGIFKPGVPAVVWGRDQETQPVFERTAATVGAPLYFAEDYPVSDIAETLALDLSGPCQDINLRTVLAALTILPVSRDRQPAEYQRHIKNRLCDSTQTVSGNSLSFNDLQNTVSETELQNILRAISNAARITGFRGRWETLLSDPLTICDIGHNPPAMEANCRKLEQLRAAPLLFVYGAMRDKDVDSIKQYLPTDAEYYLVQPQTSRAMPLQELALKLKSFNCIAAGSVAQGVEQALERARNLPGAIIFTGGSTFVVSEAITYIELL